VAAIACVQKSVSSSAARTATLIMLFPLVCIAFSPPLKNNPGDAACAARFCHNPEENHRQQYNIYTTPPQGKPAKY
jgi:hypothetical protein